MAITRKHPAFCIMRQLAQPSCGAPDVALLRGFKAAVRGELLAVAGRRGAPPREHAVVLDWNDAAQRTSLPTLTVYVHEDDALRQLGAQAYIMAPFELVVAAAQRTRIDVLFDDGGSVLPISHATLLAMRDLSHMTADGLVLPGEQVMEHHDAIGHFALYARRYCSRQGDIGSLHLASLAFASARPLLAGILSADHYAVHARALTTLANRLFEPSWRFVLCDTSTAPAAAIAAVRRTPPCYDRALHQPWWRRLRQRFETTSVELIRMEG